MDVHLCCSINPEVDSCSSVAHPLFPHGVLCLRFSPAVREFLSMDNPRGGVAMYDDVPIDEPPPVVVRRPFLSNCIACGELCRLCRVQVPMLTE